MDEQRLRALASAASIGPWSVHGNNCDEWYVYALHARYETLPGNPSPVKVAWVPWSPGTLRHEHDAAYIAAVSPDVVTALLDERDAAMALLRRRGRALVAIESIARNSETAIVLPDIARIAADALLGGGEG